MSRLHHGINVVRMIFWIPEQEFSSIHNFFANAARSCMHNPFTVVLFISFNSDWPFNGATLVFYLCTFKETIWDFEATECFGNFFLFFLKFQIWRSLKVWLRFIKRYWNWIKVRRSGHDNRRGGERLAANDLIIISPSGDGLDSSSGTDSPVRTGLDVPERFFHLTLS